MLDLAINLPKAVDVKILNSSINHRPPASLGTAVFKNKWNRKTIDHRQNYADAHGSRSTLYRRLGNSDLCNLNIARRCTAVTAIYPDRQYCFRNSDISDRRRINGDAFERTAAIINACRRHVLARKHKRSSPSLPFLSFFPFTNSIANIIEVLIKPIVNWRAVPGGRKRGSTTRVRRLSLIHRFRFLDGVAAAVSISSRLVRILIFHRENRFHAK